MGNKENVYGEGNYEATRDYNDATKKFVESGKVDAGGARRRARSPREAAEMKQAEQAALLAREGFAARSRNRRRRACARGIRARDDQSAQVEIANVKPTERIHHAALRRHLLRRRPDCRAVRFRRDRRGRGEIAKILFFIFLVLFVVSLVAGLIRRGT